MKTISNNSKLLLAIGLIVAAVIFRIIPHPFNMTPLIAIVLFAIIKGINSAKKKEVEAPATPAAPPAQEVLLGEIRDLLKEKK